MGAGRYENLQGRLSGAPRLDVASYSLVLSACHSEGETQRALKQV